VLKILYTSDYMFWSIPLDHVEDVTGMLYMP